ncbi:MAG: dephospho-CoA kinase [Polaribacter sp.]|nr:dephospho-CoA kinase [Polaribacter sp.]MDG1810513.1 dephospho-CoA kinase [Polaribacter sp.]MDG1994817.1 dephospho-CoA kinase [Polaribacter sp.]
MIVGLTGGIGSGKSTVAKMFASVGNIAIYYADKEAKRIMNTSTLISAKISDIFGKDSYENNQLNKNYIAKIVFSNPKKLAALNAIVHPEVYKHFKAFVEKNSDKDYILYENAILFENNSDILCDKIVTVSADKKLKIERVMARDGATETEVESRMNNQWTDIKKEMLANYIIKNNVKSELLIQVVRIHNILTK